MPTIWNSAGVATRIGPTGKAGLATDIQSDGIIVGYYENTPGTFVPWVRTSQGDFNLPAPAAATNEQMAMSLSDSSFYISGYVNSMPVVWEAINQPDSGQYRLIVSPTLPLALPAGASFDQSVRRFVVVEDSLGIPTIFGQYNLPIKNAQGQVIGQETHAAVWNIDRTLLHDFGANTEMLGAAEYAGVYVIAHRDSISTFDGVHQSRFSLNALIGSPAPAGTTRRVLDDGLIVSFATDDARIGVNYVESAASSQNKIVIVPLLLPVNVGIDAENDGVFEGSFSGVDMELPVLTPLSLGTRTARAKIVYSDGSQETVSANYTSLPFAKVPQLSGDELRIGGTSQADSVTLRAIDADSYQVTSGSTVQTFDAIQSIKVRMAGGSDRLIMTSGARLDLANLSGVEEIDMSSATSEQLTGISIANVSSVVGASGTLTIKYDKSDIRSIQDKWKLASPQTSSGQVNARLTSGSTTLVMQSTLYTNPVTPQDTNGDGNVTALDALHGINYINQSTSGTPTIPVHYLDVNGSGFVSALDVLLVINYINQRTGGQREGEQDSVSADLHVVVAPDSSVASIVQWIDVEFLPNARRRSIS